MFREREQLIATTALFARTQLCIVRATSSCRARFARDENRSKRAHLLDQSINHAHRFGVADQFAERAAIAIAGEHFMARRASQ